MANENYKHKKLSSFAKYGIIIGISLILVGFILAHLSNASAITWPAQLERPAHIFFHVFGPVVLVAGILIRIFIKIRN